MRNNIFAVYANYTNSEHIEISSQEALSRYLDQSFSFVNSYKVRKRRKNHMKQKGKAYCINNKATRCKTQIWNFTNRLSYMDIAVFLCTAPCRGNMPQKRRMGRAASRREGHSPTRLHTGTQRKIVSIADECPAREQERRLFPCQITQPHAEEKCRRSGARVAQRVGKKVFYSIVIVSNPERRRKWNNLRSREK